MMETLTLGSAADNQNEQILHVAAAEVLGNHQHHRSSVEEDQMMNLSDMTDLSQEIEDIDGGFVPVAKEVIFISLVSQEQALYNPKHENYRNTHKRDTKWLEIADRVGWSEMQCKSKWKAMRDQYCRELKRSKSNAKTNIKWKYFKELDFLRPYALARNYRPRNSPATNSHHINSSNNNNNNTFNCSAGGVTPNGISSEQPENHNSSPKFPTIKLEAGTPTISFTNCDFSSAKSDTSNNVITEEQLNNVLQQQSDDNNWNYITATNSNSANNNTRLDNHTLSDTTQHLLNVHQQGQQHHAQQQQQQATDEAFYNALVDCVGQIQQQHEQQLCQQQNSNQEHQQQQQPSNTNNDEEDDDPIHTFLNIESYFEKELIALIRNEDVLYNSANPNYRNVKLKLVVWDEIARKLKKTVKQCRLKWKALRDQFIREHKRLRNRNDIETLSKWKHYDTLIFLQNFMKQKPSEYVLSKNMLQIMPKTEMIENDINEENEGLNNISNSSPLRTPLENIKCDLSQSQLQMQQHMATVNDGGQSSVGLTQTNGGLTDNLSVNPGSVGGYDDMDIDNYIIGDGGSVVNEHHDQDNETDTEEDRKSQQDFAVFSNHNTNLSNDMNTSAALEQRQQQDQHHQQQQQQQQHINMPSLDLNDNNTASVLINPDDLNATTTANSNSSYTQNHLTNSNDNNNITLSSAITPLDICTAVTTSNTNQKQVIAPLTCEAATNTLPLGDNNNGNNCSAINTNTLNTMGHVPLLQQQQQQEDDEVGAFFKAVAMKIRNAKLSPVTFTDLQIDILRVINSSLRNH